MVRGGGPRESLHVRVDKASNLQVRFIQEALSYSGHHNQGQLGIKQHNSSNYAELLVKSTVHEELNSHVLNLNKKMDNCLNTSEQYV